MNFCRTIAGHPPEAMAAGKLALEMVAELGQDQARNLERLVQSSLKFTDEYKTMLQQARERLGSRSKGAAT